jgi:hypothetical protein
MNLNISYDSATQGSAPSSFFSAVNYVVGLFDATFTNNATVNIEVGYGAFPFDGSTVPALGESEQNNLVFGNYSQVRQALLNEGAPGATTLPTTSPLGGGLVLGSAQEKALGIIGPSSTLDGWVGIASDATLHQIGGSWSYSATATPGSNQYYLVGVLEHEITEVMGRTSYLDVRNEYSVMDLYRYKAPGLRQTGTGGPAYFSTNGGATNLDSWNTQSTGDIGDWAGSAGADAFLAFDSSGQINGMTNTDVTLMAALGWTTQTGSPAPPPASPPPPRAVPASFTVLVDSAWYDAQYPDVAMAGVNPALHYYTYGWHEGRDPDAYFSTTGYLDAQPDVRAAGINPLLHYDQYGWTEGRDPSWNFDTQYYLIHAPDVAVAHIDPLQHYLQNGASESRLILPAVGPTSGITATDFDREYYLMANPDVAAAAVDPYQHFLTYGWHESRNPNGLFDTSYYLSHNPDVAAAGVDPLLHYDQYGWREGRDPSPLFSTNGYLAANPDVAGAHVDPLDHFLRYGLYEGRLP